MRPLLLTLALLTLSPVAAYADGGERTTPNPCGCNYAGSEPYYLGPDFGIWWVDVSGASPVPTAVQPVTGQIAYVISTSGPPHSVTIPGGATILYVPTLTPASVYTASLPPAPPIQVNIWTPPSTVVTGASGPSHYTPAPLGPNLWHGGDPLPGTSHDAGSAAPTGSHDPGTSSAGDSPHQ